MINKNNKKIIVFISIIIILIVLLIIGFLIFNNKDVQNESDDISDSKRIKEEYEGLNNIDDNIIVNLKDNNVFMYSSKNKIIKTLNSGTDLIFIGKNNDQNSRNIINILNYLNLNRILYISMDSKEIKELLNEYNIESDNEIKCVVIGVNNGQIVGYNINTIDEKNTNEKLDNESINTLKLKFDEIVSEVSGDACDIEKTDGC